MRILAEHPGETIPQVSGSDAQSQNIYRFLSNARVNPKQILASHRPSLVTRVNQQAVVLAIEDTTDLDYTRLKQTSGLGFICQTNQQGIKVHSCLAVSGEGEPLGSLHQYTWSRIERSGKAKEKRKKATSDKESQRWLDTLTALTYTRVF